MLQRPSSSSGLSSSRLSRTHLEYMERLKLDIPALIPQEVHHHPQIGLGSDITSHNRVVCSVKEDLAEEFERLPLRHIVGGKDEGGVHVEELRSSAWSRVH